MSTFRLLLGGLKSRLPARSSYSMQSAPVDARYGYALWLRHVLALAEHGVVGPFNTVVELGPGNSVATGVCAILSGARVYTGIDVLNHLARDQAARVYDETLSRFRNGAPIPGSDAYPNLCPRPSSLAYPAAALASFASRSEQGPYSVEALQRDIALIGAGGAAGEHLRYVFPWSPDSVAAGTADLIFSQAVLEEIPHTTSGSPLRAAFMTMMDWLRPGGIASHQIDLGMYGHTPWNIHWTWSDLTWALIRGHRDNFVNREPLSTYTALAESVGFEVVHVGITMADGVPDADLSARFRRLGREDKTASGAHLLLRRPMLQTMR
jgi:hypothetical protein